MKTSVNRLVLRLQSVGRCPSILWMVPVCWQRSHALWREIILNIGWWFFDKKNRFNVLCGCGIRPALYPLAWWQTKTGGSWLESLLMVMFLLVLQTSLGRTGTHILLMRDDKYFIPTKNSSPFIPTVPWPGSLTQLGLYYLEMLSPLGGWQMDGVSTVSSHGTHRAVYGLMGFILKGTLKLIILIAVAMRLQNLISWCWCNWNANWLWASCLRYSLKTKGVNRSFCTNFCEIEKQTINKNKGTVSIWIYIITWAGILKTVWTLIFLTRIHISGKTVSH